MATFNIMPLYTDAYLADTLHLDTEQHGAYLLLLMAAWRAGGKLPADPAVLQRITKVPPRRWGKMWKVIGAFFAQVEVGGNQMVSQKRQLEVYEKALVKRAAAVENGRLGGRPKSLISHDGGKANGSSQLTQHRTQDDPKPKAEPIPAETHGKALLNIESESLTTPTTFGTTARERARVVGEEKGTIGVEESRYRLNLPPEDPEFVQLAIDIVKIYENANIIGVPDTRILPVWKETGFTTNLIRAVIQANIKPGKFVKLTYFQPILERVHAEKANLPAIPPEPEMQWDKPLELFKKSRFWMLSMHTPAPGQPGCTVPPEKLAEYGL